MEARPSQLTGKARPENRSGRGVSSFQEGAPPRAAGRCDQVGLGTKAAEDAVPVLYRLSYVARDGGTRTRNLRIEKEPPPAQQADRHVKVRDNRRDIDGCKATVRTRTSWFRARRGTSSTTSQCVWTGGLEPPTPGSRRRCAPVGLRQRVFMGVDQAGVEPAAVSLQGSRRFRSRLARESRGRESNPRARRMR